MIRHYVTLIAEFPEVDGEEMMDLSIDHHFLLAHFGGIAYDTDTEKWLSAGQLDKVSADHDGNLLQFISQALYNSVPDATA